MKILNSNNKNFDKSLDNLLSKRKKKLKSGFVSVSKIINDVKKNGDKSLIKYAAKFDKVKISKKDLSLDLSKIKIQPKVEPQVFNLSLIHI